jgi:hypothetical protein
LVVAASVLAVSAVGDAVIACLGVCGCARLLASTSG